MSRSAPGAPRRRQNSLQARERAGKISLSGGKASRMDQGFQRAGRKFPAQEEQGIFFGRAGNLQGILVRAGNFRASLAVAVNEVDGCAERMALMRQQQW